MIVCGLANVSKLHFLDSSCLYSLCLHSVYMSKPSDKQLSQAERTVDTPTRVLGHYTMSLSKFWYIFL